MHTRKNIVFYRPPGSADEVIQSEVTRTTLTKKLFFSIPARYILESNRCTSRFVSCFVEPVLSSIEDREQQWDRIVAAGASYRLCNVYAHALLQ